MRTTLNLNDDLISESVKLSGISNRTKIIELALSDFVRKLRRDKIKKACGELDLKVDVIELRKKEINE